LLRSVSLSPQRPALGCAGHLGSFDGTAFAHDGVIVVTINYRLGALGNFAHAALTQVAKPNEPLASYALLDAIALRRSAAIRRTSRCSASLQAARW
jgi:hypothetical protein